MKSILINISLFSFVLVTVFADSCYIWKICYYILVIENQLNLLFATANYIMICFCVLFFKLCEKSNNLILKIFIQNSLKMLFFYFRLIVYFLMSFVVTL